jgi:hypothetical protein
MNPVNNWKNWLIGAANAVVSAVASGVPATLAGVTFKQLAIIAGSSALISFSKWIAQHPLPGA